MAGLPDNIKAIAEFCPVEDIILPILRDGLPSIEVKSLIAVGQQFPFVLARRSPGFGSWDGDPRFTDSAQVVVHTFCEDPNGDEDASILAEAVRVVLRNAWFDHVVIPGRGHITKLVMTSAPRRVTDWATATGPVQYADLPTGVWRYQTEFQVDIKKSRTPPYPIPTP